MCRFRETERFNYIEGIEILQGFNYFSISLIFSDQGELTLDKNEKSDASFFPIFPSFILRHDIQCFMLLPLTRLLTNYERKHALLIFVLK